ncbi:hypothetical protein [uncultured Stenotrophomonas sp.]|uniref:hypothetical protein n=1 Tax=uncultured Stenotrophomonas sp. TaxID=165438 RepID=UPI0025D19483|nr:hypothetical protein [uncultured Stenotrophomonas sp.]
MSMKNLLALELVKSEKVVIGADTFHVTMYIQKGGGGIAKVFATDGKNRSWSGDVELETVIDASGAGLDLLDVVWSTVIDDLKRKVDLLPA